MTRPLTILLDCDGVLADTVSSALGIVRELCGREYCADDVTDYDLGLLLPEEHRAEFWRRFAAPGFCAGMLPYPTARLAVEDLQALGHRVEIVTAPMRDSATWVDERRAWLLEHFGIPAERVHSTHDKAKVPGDIFVDDHPKHVQAWKDAHPGGIALVYERPYNRWLSPTLPYATGWHTIAHAIRLLQIRRSGGAHGDG